ncbi:UxaA family hydrolase [Mycolicibacterium confluentis]|uniref:Galactarate dehydratase n=1 Tax=Mycolicibacterium confluentis TaxID=28047 RepID=A0A7I7XWS7_9MYCO|nr:altronate dehydratase family protein [Mycolicibacterium confluentis]MCV7321880.1 altronate dehydratase [Mycolicibacterium confluentis]ORV32134.1 galactonate dehydratase [Mycolicibacterium confluentis]BBZ33697.1 galactarate dehydratase [Mycolicibacterium confluentis]
MPTAQNVPTLIQLDPRDSVGLTRQHLPRGAVISTAAGELTLVSEVPRSHKVALRPIARGEEVRRYGQIIGFAAADIRAGEHVHLHNLEYQEFDREYEYCVDARPEEVLPASERATFRGYVRSDGRVGTRNYIGVLTTVNCSATAAKRIVGQIRQSGVLEEYPNIDGIVALTHGTGCGMAQVSQGMEILRRTMRGYLGHPNFGGFLVLGLGCEDNQISMLTRDVSLRADLPIAYSTIQELGGTAKTVQAGVAVLQGMFEQVNRAQRVTVPASELILGTNCGGSDAFSGITANPALGNAVDRLVRQGGAAIVGETPEIYGTEHMLVRRAASESVATKLLERIEWWRRYTEMNDGTMDNNPSPGNKDGGLTTILEKSLGAVAKGGTTTLREVLEYAEPVTSKGFIFMDTPGFDPVSVTGIIAGGANLVCFTTGRGSAFGCAPVPSLKLATNSELYARMTDDMDINCGGIADGTATVSEIGEQIFNEILRVASGTQTKSEEFGYGDEEFVPWLLGTVM